MEQKLSRRAARENAFKAIFAFSFEKKDAEAPEETPDFSATLEEYELDAFGEGLVRSFLAHQEEIDRIIDSHLKSWTFQRVPRVSLTAVRVALSEMLYGTEKLPSVAINEAVELAKNYGAEADYQFVNGILGVVLQDLGLLKENTADTEPAGQE